MAGGPTNASPPTPSYAMPQSLLDLANQDEAAAAEKMKADLIEVNSALFGHAQTYTTVVIFGAYAAFFTIWSFSRADMTRDEAYWVGLLIGISVLSFVLFEIFKMVVNAGSMMALRRLLARDLTPSRFLAERQVLATNSDKFLFRFVIPVWVVALVVSVGAGVGACGVLMKAFVAYLATPT